MPLRDHFHPPLSDQRSWEELHGVWPSTIAFRFNAILPPDYYSGVKIHVGTMIELDVAAFEAEDRIESGTPKENVAALAWAPSHPTLLLDSEMPESEYEVRVYDERHNRRLVAAVEIVSPRNKDRAESRDAFVSKCHALLRQDVCIAIVDVVTERSANLYAELAERIGAEFPTIGDASIYAVSCRAMSHRGRWRVDAWPHELAIGSLLPTLPLWLTDTQYVPLELETTYEEACRGLRIQ